MTATTSAAMETQRVTRSPSKGRSEYSMGVETIEGASLRNTK